VTLRCGIVLVAPLVYSSAQLSHKKDTAGATNLTDSIVALASFSSRHRFGEWRAAWYFGKALSYLMTVAALFHLDLNICDVSLPKMSIT